MLPSRKRNIARWMFALFLLAPAVYSQDQTASPAPWASHVIIPQSRVFGLHQPAQVQIQEVQAGVVILEQVATTTLEISLINPTASRLEAELIVPVPDRAAVQAFTFQGAAQEPTAQLLPKDEARKTYEAIVAKTRDPAILEFLGYNLIRTSVFPVEPQGRQKLRLTYEHLLPAEGDRVDYILPRSESVDYNVPWKVNVKIRSRRPISTLYSPSHDLEIVRSAENVISARTSAAAVTTPGPFRLYYLLEKNEMSASFLAYPDPKVGGGYFLMFAGIPASPLKAGSNAPVRREVTLVIDRSGSMRGEKLQQAHHVALQIIESLQAGEAFNLILYNQVVELFARQPVSMSPENLQAARTYLKNIEASGGTNIHDALLEALRQKTMPGHLPIVLFLTDGLPTIGRTSEAEIRDMVMNHNPSQRRIFTFGVGLDVNTPLLEKIAYETRATSTFVLPQEDVSTKVSQVFRRLAGPVLAYPEFETLTPEGGIQPGRFHDIFPTRLPDLFEGDQLVLLGQYVGDSPITFALSGEYLGQKRTFRFTFSLEKASTLNAFVPRLWASRKIAMLIDAIRQTGAVATSPGAPPAPPDAEIRKLVDEVIRLSTAFGILTEYTAFLALEGTDLSRKDAVLAEAGKNFKERAIDCRSGLASVNQEINAQYQKSQKSLSLRNSYWDKNMNRVDLATVQQINDLAFYRRGDRWIDSRVAEQPTSLQPKKIIEFGSEEFRRLALRLASEGRQGSISLRGDVLMIVEGEPVLVKGFESK